MTGHVARCSVQAEPPATCPGQEHDPPSCCLCLGTAEPQPGQDAPMELRPSMPHIAHNWGLHHCTEHICKTPLRLNYYFTLCRSAHEEASLHHHLFITLYLFPPLKHVAIAERGCPCGCEQGVCSASHLKHLHGRLVSSRPRWGEEYLSLTSLFHHDL